VPEEGIEPASLNSREPLQNKPDRAPHVPDESSHFDTARDESQPLDTGAGTKPTSVDDVIRIAAKAAIGAGDPAPQPGRRDCVSVRLLMQNWTGTAAVMSLRAALGVLAWRRR
jgi:hypothetical protein